MEGSDYDEYAEANFYNNLGVVWQKGTGLIVLFITTEKLN